MSFRRRGFTLIELLVVIAIIGILAAMLFPVFARARESARKTQCLANVKNIAIAVNMYLTDWDAFWPKNHDKGARDAFVAIWNDPVNVTMDSVCLTNNNPYLRPSVILDDYIKNRDVWRCPSAKVQTGAGFIVPMGRDGLWYNAFVDNMGSFGVTWGPDTPQWGTLGQCNNDLYPPGWGGAITDSFVQGPTYGTAVIRGGALGQDEKSFVKGISILNGEDFGSWFYYQDKKTSYFDDPTKAVIVSDSGAQGDLWPHRGFIAFPDICGPHAAILGCGLDYAAEGEACCFAIPPDFPATRAQYDDFRGGGPLQKSLTRHMGGSNLGFMDGHAKWWPAMEIFHSTENGTLTGFCGTGNCMD